MKNKSLLFRLFAVVMAVMFALGIQAAEAYACYTSSNTTLTFYYDNQRSSRTGTTYNLNTDTNDPGWYTDGTKDNVTKVVFDLSFAAARPTATRSWFNGMKNLQSITNLSYLNTGEVTNMVLMFGECSKLTSLYLSNFNTAKVTLMSSMFYGCSGLTSLNLSSFNTSNVIHMYHLFYNCSNLKTIYVGNGWSTTSVVNSGEMFTYCSNLVGGQGTVYDPRHSDKTYAHVDGGPSNPGYFTDPNAPVPYACYTPSNTTLTFYYDNQRSSRTGTTYNLNTDTDFPGWYTDGTKDNVTKVVFDSSFAGARPTTTGKWFYEMANLQSITGMEYLNTSEVTDMALMFDGCNQLTSIDVSHFNTANVTKMPAMFYGCSSLTSLDLSSFNTVNVTNMSAMFVGCGGLTSLNVSGFNTANVTDMSNMFNGCEGLTSLDVSHFNTANVTNMFCMFFNCNRLTRLDLSSFNTSKVTDMSYMFRICNNLRTIYVGNGWSTAAVANSTDMFYNCTSLVGGQGTAYSDSNPTDKTYARIDGGTSNPGYFTDPNAPVAYACYTPSNTTLTFYYDKLRGSRPGTTYDLNTGSATPGWKLDGSNASVTRVVFDPSFAAVRPTSTYMWFDHMEHLNGIVGMSNLNTSSVTVMSFMFNGCRELQNPDLSGFNTANVMFMSSMFSNCDGLASLDLSSFNTAKVTDMLAMFESCTSLKSVDLSSFNTAQVTNMNSMFYGCSRLQALDLSSFNTARVTNMGTMFYNCSNLVAIVVGDDWTTSAVTSSSYMFLNCTSLVGGQGTTYSTSHLDKAYAHIDGGTSNPGYLTDINDVDSYAEYSDGTLTFYFDGLKAIRPGTTFFLNAPGESPAWSSYFNAVSTVVFDPSFAIVRPNSMRSWFDGMSNLTSITGVEYLNTSRVTDMNSLFNGCSSLSSVDVSNFDTRNVTGMNSMFRDCAALQSLALSSFDTRNVTDMNTMFRGCTGLTELDLSSFNTANVTKMIWMFYKCTNLATIFVGTDWNTSNVTSSANMFADCTSLVGGQGTAYSASNPKDKTYAHIDGGTSNPGYFTAKNTSLRGDVDGDGEVAISDVSALIDYLLTGDASSINLSAADCDIDGEVAISDVSVLIDYLLSGAW